MRQYRLPLLLLLLWTAVMAWLFLWGRATAVEHTERMALHQGRAFFEQVVTTRAWNAAHGGVYVFVTPETQPNPWLEDPQRDLTTTDGRLLTKINPAYMTRQVSELAESMGSKVRFHITSNNPLRPDNSPDPWEAAALQSFEAGREERFALVSSPPAGENPQAPHYRYMAPLHVTAACLPCHAKQGYQVGDIRGGISVDIPAAPFQAAFRNSLDHILRVYGSFWFFGGLGIFLTSSELLRRKQAAEASNRAKSTFLATMSHELRTPLNGMIGMTALCLESDLDEEQREYLTMAQSSAHNLLGLLNDILDLSKIEADKLDFEHQPFNLNETVEHGVESLAAQAQAKELELSCWVDPALPPIVLGDPKRLQQILLNLLGNALKFTETGEISCTLAPLPQMDYRRLRKSLPKGYTACLLRVEDTGIGIAPEDQQRIFEPFTQSESGIARRFGGTGLGLAISQRLVERMGGSVWLESRPNQGSVFSCSLVFAPAPSEMADPAFDTAPEPPPRHEGTALLVLPGPRQRSCVTALLRARGLEGLAAPSLAEALELLAPDQAPPLDLLLLDAGLCLAPEHEDALQELLRHPRCLAARRVILTAPGAPQPHARGKEGLPLHSIRLRKPVTSHSLCRMFEECRETAALSARPEETRPLRVLVAEDNLVNRTAVTRLLQNKGHQVLAVEDGLQAVQRFAQSLEPDNAPFDLLLLDISMPVLDGKEATRRIRDLEQERKLRRTPIVALTAHALHGDRERLLQSGLDAYLPKPVELALLLRTMATLTANTTADANPEGRVPGGEDAVAKAPPPE